MLDTNVDNETSLWECLHDGDLEAFSHDPLSRVAVLTWKVAYVASFHSLPEEARFLIRLEGVREMDVLEYRPWPGAESVSNHLPWDQQEKIRRENRANSHYASGNWTVFAESVSTSEYECSNASLSRKPDGFQVLSLDLSNSVANDYPTVRFTHEDAMFSLSSGQQLSFEEFLALGAAYWHNFAKRAAQATSTL